MDVTHTPVACRLPSNDIPVAVPARKGSRAAKAAVSRARHRGACTACCVLPFTLPAVISPMSGVSSRSSITPMAG